MRHAKHAGLNAFAAGKASRRNQNTVAAVPFWIYTRLLSVILEMLIKYCGEMTVCTECCYVWGGGNANQAFWKKLGVLLLQFCKKCLLQIAHYFLSAI